MPYSLAFYVHSVPFTRDVVEGRSSLGGSESACLGLARALAVRGHDVHIFATQLSDDVPQEDAAGVQWHPAADLASVVKFHRHDVFVSLRMPHLFSAHVPAKLRVLWNQDLRIGTASDATLAALDKIVFVSEYHRAQWIGDRAWLQPLAYVTRNGIDPADLPELDTDFLHHPRKKPFRFIHVSRPERGLDALLAYWPRLKAALPDATLQLCRYSSMYDATGWGQVCAQYDAKVAQVQAQVGGLEYLGELNKPALYKAIAEAEAMLYPTSQPGFAETNCIAATEAQACGTPFIGHWRGALPETVHPDAGILLDAPRWDTVEAADAFVAAVKGLVQDRPRWKALRQAGLDWTRPRAFHATIAAEWEQWLDETFATRYRTHRTGVLRQFRQWDNILAGSVVAHDILGDAAASEPEIVEAQAFLDEAGTIIRQEAQTATEYAKFALADVEAETNSPRFKACLERVLEEFEARQAALPEGQVFRPRVLDVAAGNGAFALMLLRAWPTATVTLVDYSATLMDRASEALTKAGFRDRHTTVVGEVWDAINQTPRTLPVGGGYDLVWVGEFLEHTSAPHRLLDALETYVHDTGLIFLSTPCGPFLDLLEAHFPLQRGHVCAFDVRDVLTLLSPKRDAKWEYWDAGLSPRGNHVGHWFWQYRRGGDPAGALTPDHFASTVQRERPLERITACLILRNEATNVLRCLQSFWKLVDHVVVADFGSVDGTLDIVRAYAQAQPWKLTILQPEWPDHFAAARNLTVQAAEARGTEWILWIDADEILEGGFRVRRFTESPVFNAIVIEQRHLAVDVATYADKPLRLFRANRGVQFFGPVHEQPEETPDVGINPALHQADTYLVHLGYLTDPQRRDKMLRRNLRLLLKAVKAPEGCRELDWLLLLRDRAALCAFAREQAPSADAPLSPEAQMHLREALAIWDRHPTWAEPGSRFHDIAWPLYQGAMLHYPSPISVAWTFGATQGPMERTPTLAQFRVRTPAEAAAYITRKVALWTKELTPVLPETAPVVTRVGHGVPVEVSV